MLKKLFGSNDEPASTRLPDRARLERLLAEIAMDTPRAEWVALVSSSGRLQASFPGTPPIPPETIAAMSAAMDSLGERIAKELRDGALRYTLIAGDEESTLMVVLGPKHRLTVGLRPDVSVDAFLQRLPASSEPLRKVLHLDARLDYPSIEQ